MKVQANAISQFIKSPPQEVNCFLIYGPDYGLTQERLSLLKNHFITDSQDPFSSSQLEYETIKKEPALLADELGAISLFGGRKVIIIKEMPGTPVKAVLDALAVPDHNAIVLITAGDLAPSSGLRKLCEKEKHCAAIACYKDDSRSIRGVISQFFSQRQVQYEPQVIDLLANNFGGDRLVILSELEKLHLYVGEGGKVTVGDVEACVMDNAELLLDELCYNLMSLQGAQSVKKLHKAFAEGATAITILRALSRYVLKLLEGHMLLNSGTALPQVAKMMRPPIFFKYQALFTEHLRLWPEARLEKLLSHLITLEKETKTTAMPAELLCKRFMLMVPLAIRGRA